MPCTPTRAAPPRISSIPLLIVLIAALALGFAPALDARLVQVGELLWPGYALRLRVDPAAPDCDTERIQADLARCEPGARLPSSAEPLGGADPFAGEDPFAAAPPAGSDAPAVAGADSSCEALPSLLRRCQQRHTEHQEILSRLTTPIRFFRAGEGAVATLARLPAGELLLSLLLVLGAFSATVSRAHVALRRPSNPLEDRVAEAAQLVANGFLLASCVADLLVQRGSGLGGGERLLPGIWALGFGALVGVNLLHLLRPARFPEQPFRVGPGLLLLPPLYAWLAVASGLWFVLVERHPSGQAIFLHKFVQYPSIYLGVGLYVLSGMLFSGTRLAALAFDVVRPFRLPPPLLCWLTGVAAAVPTAYSGASGIFVIAAGREIYDKLRLSGASRRLAWAATAMSGSLGVVLRPCLLVVLIAALNKQVTTDALFGRGLQVFALTSAIYGAVMLLRVRRPFLVPGPPLAEAAPASLKALLRLLPYLGVGGLILAGLGVGLGVWLNEFTAPLLVPLVLMGVVAWESRQASREAPAARFLPELRERLRWASLASSGNVGALLLLMSASIGLGGVIERAEWMRLLPQVSGSPFATMALLVVVLVLVGMIMDPMGAVVLVSVTIAGKAQEAGIDPVHFWMVVLVAFELGYLTPPVALNQLLTRQVVGAEEGPEAEAATGFLTRYDHVLTPVAILGIALLLVAFVPLWLGSRAGG